MRVVLVEVCVVYKQVSYVYHSCWFMGLQIIFFFSVKSSWNITHLYRVIHKSVRDFRPLRYSSRDGHAEGKHVSRGRDTPSFCPTLQVLDMSNLGDAAGVNHVIKFLPHTCSGYFTAEVKNPGTYELPCISRKNELLEDGQELRSKHIGEITNKNTAQQICIKSYTLFSYYLRALYQLGQPLWSSGQSFWLQIQRSRVRFPALPDFLSNSGSGTGSIQPREVNWGATWIKSSGSVPENRD